MVDINSIISGLTWWQALIAGAVIGLVFMPFVLLFRKAFALWSARRKIRKMIKKNEFLIPIDPQDWDTKSPWRNQINPEQYKGEIDRLNNSIFNKKI